jgi:FixJ family two-component response regulator
MRMNASVDRSGMLVCVVDDDHAVRESLRLLIETQGVEVRAYERCIDFLDDPDRGRCACLVLDVRLPGGMSGLQLQQRLQENGDEPPIVFISGHADVPMAVKAMRAGAVDFLQKPFPEQALLDRIEQALDMFGHRQRRRMQQSALVARYSQLTAREKDVLECILKGHVNKQIADILQISIKTVEQHRSRVMEKMRVNSLAELVQAIERLRRG